MRDSERSRVIDYFEDPYDNWSMDYDNLRLSYSGFNCYVQCPLQWRFKYVDRVPQTREPDKSLVFGSTVHGAINRFYNGTDRSMDALQYCLDVEYKERYFVAGGPIFPSHEEDLYEARRQLRLLHYRHEREGLLDCPFRSELKFEFKPREFKGVTVNGFIDNLFFAKGVPQIVDYKTGSTRYSQKEVDENDQLTIYAMFAKSKGMDVEKCAIHMTKFDSKIFTKRTTEHFQDLILRMEEVVERIRSQDFPATPSFKSCRFCPFNKMCPESMCK